MNLVYIFLGISVIVWSTIPFRHVGKKYFYFFYFLAFSDPLTLLLRTVFHSGSNFLIYPCYYLAFIGLQDKYLVKGT